jgi:selenocysteine lyase/cysteine desulfurase
MALEGARDFHALPSSKLRLAPGARRWDSAETANFTNLAAFDSSLELILRIGTEAIQNWIDTLVAEIIDGLPRTKCLLASPAERERRGPYVCISARNPEHTTVLYEKLRTAKISVSLRGDALRIAPHIYNTTEDISRLMKTLSE